MSFLQSSSSSCQQSREDKQQQQARQRQVHDRHARAAFAPGDWLLPDFKMHKHALPRP